MKQLRQERLPRKEADKNQNRNNHNRAYTLYQHLSVMTTVKWNCYKTVISLTPSAIRITTTHNKEEHKKKSVFLQQSNTENILSLSQVCAQQHPIARPLRGCGQNKQIQYLVLSSLSLPFSLWDKKDTKCCLLLFSCATMWKFKW